jgi:NADH dehydrogenase
MVTAIDEDGVTVGDEQVQAKTVLWGAGVAASPLGRSLGVPVDKLGRVLVEPDLTIPGHPEVHVVGDLAMLRQADGKQVPGVAPAAIQEGRWEAENVLRALQGKTQRPFRDPARFQRTTGPGGRAATAPAAALTHPSGRARSG